MGLFGNKDKKYWENIRKIAAQNATRITVRCPKMWKDSPAQVSLGV